MPAQTTKGSYIMSSQTRTNKFTLLLLAVAFFYAAVVQTTTNDWETASGSTGSSFSSTEHELHWIHKAFFNNADNKGKHHSNDETNLRRNLRRQPQINLLPPSLQDSGGSINQNDNKSNTDPIDPHNKICRNYLLKFLQGSTDANDECQGLENAYSAADCSEEISFVSPVSGGGGDEPTNHNSTPTDDTTNGLTDDTPTIDDFFQEFQCCKVISHYYSSRCLYHHQYASLSLLGIVAVLILCNLTKSALHILQIKWLPEAGGCILVGSVVGAVLTMQLPDYQMNLGTFNPDLFLYILLPPIIFHASLSIDKQKFRSYLFPIMMFAVVGTIVSALITGFTVHYLTKVIGFVTTTIPLLDSMIFGALISSIDPVAVLSIMHSMGVSDTDMLYVLVFGESILNDGVSIAMFESLIMHLDGDSQEGTLDHALIWSSAQYFWRVSWMSILVGGIVGITCTTYFWALRGRHGPVAEVASFFCFAMLAYYVSDGVGGSGIVSIMVAGILMDVYVRGSHLTEGDTIREFQQVPSGPGSSLVADEAMHSQSDEHAGYPLPSSCRVPSYTDLRVMFSGVGHISDRAKIHVGFVADVLANLMETSIFAYLGLFLFSNNKWDDIPLILVGVFSCVISRVIMIGVISMIVNICGWFQEFGKFWSSDNTNPMPIDEQRPRLYIDSNMQLVMLFSGMRGAVSLALAENIPLYDAVTKHGSQFKPALKAMTSSSIIFTVFVFGASTYYTLKKQRDAQQQTDELYGVGNGRSLTTSLLQTHSLELREDDLATTPPWIVQNVTSATNGNDGNVQ